MHNYSILFEIKFWLFSHIIDTTIEMIFHMHRFFFLETAIYIKNRL